MPSNGANMIEASPGGSVMHDCTVAMELACQKSAQPPCMERCRRHGVEEKRVQKIKFELVKLVYVFSTTVSTC